MAVAKPRVQCGECFQSFAASYMRRKPDTGKRVCRTCYGEIKDKIAETPPPKETPLLWYVLYVEIDKDKQVVKDLTRQILIESREKEIPNIIAPTHRVTTYKNGQAKVTNELSFPGYIIVECRWSEAVHHFLTSTRHVWGVLPLKPQMFGKRYARKEPPTLRKPSAWEKEKAEEWKPTALESEEAARLLISQAIGTKAKDAPIDFVVGDTVKIVDGSFKNMDGPVVKITGTGKEQKATVKVKMWGHDLEVEVSPWQVVKKS